MTDCRAIQDRLLEIAARRGYSDDVQISADYASSPTLGDLRQWIYPQWLPVMERILGEIER